MKIKFYSLIMILLLNTNVFAKQVIGVTSFQNLSKDKQYDWLCIGISDTINFKLRNVKEYILVDRVNVDKILGEIALSQSGILSENNIKAGKALGANLLVVGNFQKYGNKIRITAKIIDTETHRVVNQVQVTGNINDIFDLQDKLALAIIEKNNTSISDDTKKKIIKNDTYDLDAYKYFIEGQKYLLYSLDYEKAIKKYKKAINIDKNYALAYAGLGKAYALRSWELKTYYNKNVKSLIQKSYKNCLKAIELNPDLDEAHLSLARYYQEIDKSKFPNKWELCEKETRKALEINPNNAEAYLLLSKIYAYDTQKEKKYLEIALEKNKFLVDAYNNLGVIYLNQGKLDEALTLFKKSIDMDPNFVIGYMNLGVIYERKKLYTESMEMYKKAVEKYPAYLLGLRNLGIGYRNLQQYDKSLEVLKRALEIKSDDPKTLSEIAYIYLVKQKFQKAIRYYKLSLKYDPTYKYSLANIAYCYVNIKQYDKAIPYLKKAVKLHSDYAWPAGYLGWIYEAIYQNKTEALYWYKEASKRDPDNSSYMRAITRIQDSL